ncbi:restriction endonuclease [Nocardioides sp. NPDC057767]|uniref:restriction endonuclease n=1 Tax=unclassified Nocardioides TaxID=2615069 RepID=UPI003670CC75
MASPRQPRTGEEAEKRAAEHLHSLGWPDAAPSGSTAAADVDIIGGRPDNVIVAQVVLTRAATDARSVCAVRGAGYAYDARTVALYSRAGYTSDAVEWADKVRVALFEFTSDGSIRPHGKHAAELVTTATAPAPPAIGRAPEPLPGRHIDPTRTGGFSFTAKIPAIRPRRRATEKTSDQIAPDVTPDVAPDVDPGADLGVAPDATAPTVEKIAGPMTGQIPAYSTTYIVPNTTSTSYVVASVPSTMSIPKAPTPPPGERWVPDGLGPILDAIARASQLPVVLVLGSDQRAEWVRQTFQVATITVTDESVLPMLLSLVTGRESQYASGESYHKVDGLKPQGERALESWRAWAAYDRAMANYRRAV